jgi:hypothetical protein
MNKGEPEFPQSPQDSRRSINEYLIKSNKWYLHLLGIGIQFFGLKAVIGFLLGMVAVCIYAGFKPLPFYAQRPEQKTVSLSGTVMTYEEEPLDCYHIGILDKLYPSFQTKDGSFNIKVPRKEKYDIAIWSGDLRIAQIYTGREAAQVLDRKDAYTLKRPLPGFPQNLGIVEGKVTYPNGAGCEGYVEIAGKTKKTDVDGSFLITGIPIGKVMLRVYENLNEKALCEQPITVELTGPTKVNPQVLRREQ